VFDRTRDVEDLNMSSNAHRQQRLAARAARQEKERAAAARAHRKQRLWLLAGVAAVAVVLAAAAVLVSKGGSESTPKATPGQTASLFAGIQQRGMELGSPDAPVTLVEYADLQCPYCRDYAVGALPEIVNKYVRTGKVRLEYKPLAILGPQSVAAARMANAAASQNHMWDFIDRFYSEQGQENTGYVTDAFLRKIGSEVKGFDIERAFTEAQSQDALGTLAASHTEAEKLGIDSTPSFTIGRTGHKLRVLDVTSLSPSFFSSVIQRELAR
jgi:protein-disulfide isomerase